MAAGEGEALCPYFKDREVVSWLYSAFLTHHLKITEAEIIYHTYYESSYFSLFDDAIVIVIRPRMMEIMNLK